MFIDIDGTKYQMKVRRIKGQLRLFFKTDQLCYNVHGFDFPHCGCGNIKHRLDYWKKLKISLIKGHYSGITLFPEPLPRYF